MIILYCVLVLSGGIFAGPRPSQGSAAALLTGAANPTSIPNIYPRDAHYSTLNASHNIASNGVLINQNVVVNTDVLYGSSNPTPNIVARRDSNNFCAVNQGSFNQLNVGLLQVSGTLSTTTLTTSNFGANTVTSGTGTIGTLTTNTLNTGSMQSSTFTIADRTFMLNQDNTSPGGLDSGLFVGGTLATGFLTASPVDATEFWLYAPNNVRQLIINPDAWVGDGFLVSDGMNGFTASYISAGLIAPTLIITQDLIATLGDAGLVQTSATTATPVSVANTLVSYDSTLSFAAGTITAAEVTAQSMKSASLMPTAPEGTVTIAQQILFIEVQGNYCYTVDTLSQLAVFDITNPAAPAQLGTISVDANPVWMLVKGQYVYVAATSTNAITCYDVSNPNNPVVTSSVTLGGVGAFTLLGPSLYLIGSDSLFYIIDADPQNLSIVSSYYPGGSGPATAACNQGGLAFFGLASGEISTYAIDAFFNDQPNGQSASSGFAQVNALVARGDFIYAAVADNSGNGYLAIYENNLPVSLIGSVETPSGMPLQSLALAGLYAYGADSTQLYTFSIYNLTSPSIVSQGLASYAPQQITLSGAQLIFGGTSGGNPLFGVASMTGQRVLGGRSFAACDVDSLQVRGDMAVAGNVTSEGSLLVSGNVSVYGDSAFDGDLVIDGAAATSPALTVVGSYNQPACYILPTNSPPKGSALYFSGLQPGTGTELDFASNGNIVQNVSARRFKEGIAPIKTEDLDKLMELRPVRYADKKSKRPLFGLIAEEVAELYPSLVMRDGAGTVTSVNYRAILALAVAEHQRQQKELEKLRVERGCQ